MRHIAIQGLPRARRALLLSSIAIGSVAAAAPADAKEYWLVAVRSCITAAGVNADGCTVAAHPQPTDPVPVWSFVSVTPDAFAAGAPGASAQALIPGPLLNVDSTDTLTIHLLNQLAVPTSLIVPGQPSPLNPVWTDKSGNVTGTGARPAGDTTSRVRSLNTETPPGQTANYTWSNLIPGSFIYESATHQGIQVQMGLHGGLIVASGTTTPGETTGTAYAGTNGAADITYGLQVATYLSEINSTMHRTVDLSPTHDATPMNAAKTVSPIEYWPDIFLTNQQVLNPDFTPVPPSQAGHGVLQPGVPTLMRFMNGSLRSHVQVVQDQYVNIVADDGHALPYPRTQYSLQLDAGKMKDALLIPVVAASSGPTTPQTVAVYDRMLNTGITGTTKQGMVAYLDIVPPNTPTALNDTYVTPAAPSFTTADPGVLANDISPDHGTITAAVATPPAKGTLSLNPGGGFTYTPNNASVTSDAFTYQAVEGTAMSTPATVTITLTPVAPVAAPDAYTVLNNAPSVVSAPGVLANDTDTPGHGMIAVALTSPTHGKLKLAANGGFTYTASAKFVGTDSFTYTANDGTLKSTPATVTLTVASGSPVANNDVFPAPGAPHILTSSVNVPLNVLANDTGPVVPGTSPPPPNCASVTIVKKPVRGGALSVSGCAVGFTPAVLFVGTDSFTYSFTDTSNHTSNVATVKVNVTRK